VVSSVLQSLLRPARWRAAICGGRFFNPASAAWLVPIFFGCSAKWWQLPCVKSPFRKRVAVSKKRLCQVERHRFSGFPLKRYFFILGWKFLGVFSRRGWTLTIFRTWIAKSYEQFGGEISSLGAARGEGRRETFRGSDSGSFGAPGLRVSRRRGDCYPEVSPAVAFCREPYAGIFSFVRGGG